jgi:hypothetical protein
MGRDSVFLADPGGNEFCVIEPGNNFLAGCGSLGEFTCDGTREVGLFWRDALGWSLVWDQGEQTAIQSPQGGTKISWERWPQPLRTGGIGSDSISPHLNPLWRPNDWSPSVRRCSEIETEVSGWPTPTETSS